jgi:ABC-type branched-subunit amino acid transport system substrate-binding protein
MPMLPYRRVGLAGAAAALLLVAGACADILDTGDGPAQGPTVVRLYGTDGTMQNSFIERLSDRTLVAGMKGTRPMNPLPAEFVNRLLSLDDSLQDFLFAGETYDAVVISALAAESAGTPDPDVVRDHIVSVTTGGDECRSVAACMELARSGQELQYRGVSLVRGGLTDRGEPAATTYETLHVGADGVIDPGRSEFIGAGDLADVSGAASPPMNPRVDRPEWEVEPLRFGEVLPRSGALAFAYPPISAAAQLAIADINEAGGVFGVNVVWMDGDSGTDPEVARATIAGHVADGAHILIGPAASGVVAAVMPDVAAAGRIMFSPSSTAAHLVDADHGGYYFRTAPPDSLQGAALADMLLRGGVERIVLVARDDDYGAGLQRNIGDSLRRFGVPATAVTVLSYQLPVEADADEEAGSEDGVEAPTPIPNLDTVVARILEVGPDALVLIGFDEAAQVIERLVAEGVTMRR